MGHLVCRTCGEKKDEACFKEKQKRLLKTGWKSYRNIDCTECSNLKKLEYRKNNPYSWMKSRYGISKEEAKYWYLKSRTYCEICGIPWKEGSESLCIDHDHATGRIRGILCRHCNHVLGHSRDNIKTLESAIEYLKKGWEKRSAI